MAFNFRFINTEQLKQDPRFGQFASFAGQHPMWTWKIAGTIAMLIFVIPLIVFALAALLAFFIVFAVLSLVHRVISGVRSLFGLNTPAPGTPTQPHEAAGESGETGEGRRNVRVIRSE